MPKIPEEHYFGVLDIIKDDEPTTAKEIAEYTDLNNLKLSKVLNRLLREGTIFEPETNKYQKV